MKIFFFTLFLLGCSSERISKEGIPISYDYNDDEIELEYLRHEEQVSSRDFLPVPKKERVYCMAGRSIACLKAGIHLKKQEQFSKGFEYFEMACNLKNAIGCFESSIYSYQIQKTKLAHYFMERSCKYKNGKACYEIYLKKQESHAELTENMSAFSYLKLSCRFLYGQGCQDLGAFHYKKERKSRARSYFKQACNLKRYGACYNLGLLYHRSQEVKLAKKYYLISCSKKISSSCYNLAIFYTREGKKEKALSYLEKTVQIEEKKKKEIQFDPDFDSLRSSHRYRRLLAEKKK